MYLLIYINIFDTYGTVHIMFKTQEYRADIRYVKKPYIGVEIAFANPFGQESGRPMNCMGWQTMRIHFAWDGVSKHT